MRSIIIVAGLILGVAGVFGKFIAAARATRADETGAGSGVCGRPARRRVRAASASGATIADISRPMAASTDGRSPSWSIPARR